MVTMRCDSEAFIGTLSEIENITDPIMSNKPDPRGNTPARVIYMPNRT